LADTDDAVSGGGDGGLDGVLDAIGELTSLEVRPQAFDRLSSERLTLSPLLPPRHDRTLQVGQSPGPLYIF
jgi:hypothetical protein